MFAKACLALLAFALIGCGDRSTSGSGVAAGGGSTCASSEPVRFDDAKVPPQFKDLVPLARKWGVSDDSDRSACIAASSAAERDALDTTLAGRTADIHRWLDEVKPGQALSDEQGAFLYMLNALETIDAMQAAAPRQAR